MARTRLCLDSCIRSLAHPHQISTLQFVYICFLRKEQIKDHVIGLPTLSLLKWNERMRIRSLDKHVFPILEILSDQIFFLAN